MLGWGSILHAGLAAWLPPPLLLLGTESVAGVGAVQAARLTPACRLSSVRAPLFWQQG